MEKIKVKLYMAYIVKSNLLKGIFSLKLPKLFSFSNIGHFK